MKGTFRIGGAVLFGVVIILGAFYVRGTGNQVAGGSVIVALAPERVAITTKDSDGNGVEDWEENLRERFFETISVPTSTATSDDTGPYEPPSTLTGKFSEAFMKDYLAGKVSGADFSDPSALVGSAVQAIDSSSRSKKYTRLDVARIPTSPESVRTYGNEIMGIMQEHSIDNENEALILQRALAADDPKQLEPLAPIREVYEKIVRDSLRTPVPDTLIDEHLAFLNASEAIKTDIAAMQLAFTDPLYALARIREYKTDAQALSDSLVAIAGVLRSYGAEYGNDEPGAVFYLFEL